MYKKLIDEKNRIDAAYRAKRGKVYTMARDKVLSVPVKNGKRSTRASAKLEELAERFPIIPQGQANTFLDVCGGPGAWSVYLLATGSFTRARGVTLKSDISSCNWYPEICDNQHWETLDACNGDILREGTLDQINKSCKRERYGLVVADGAIRLDGQDENLQELMNARLFNAELLIILTTVKDGGNAVCKMFDGYMSFTMGYLYVLSMLFGTVQIAKPPSSRAVNSERYIVMLDFKGRAAMYFKMISYMLQVYREWKSGNFPSSPVPQRVLLQDETFTSLYTNYMVRSLSSQITCIQAVMNEVDASDEMR